MDDCTIDVRHLHKTFGTAPALRDVSLRRSLVTRTPFWLLLLFGSATCAADPPLPAGYPTLLGVSCGGVHVTS